MLRVNSLPYCTFFGRFVLRNRLLAAGLLLAIVSGVPAAAWAEPLFRRCRHHSTVFDQLSSNVVVNPGFEIGLAFAVDLVRKRQRPGGLHRASA